MRIPSFRRSRSHRWLLPALLALTGARGADEVWRLDNLREIGGHPVTVIGAPRIAMDAAGAGRPAAVFDGAQDGLLVPAIPIAGAKAFTIEVLFSPAAGGPPAQRFVHLQDTNQWRGLIEIRLDGKGSWWLDTYLETGGKGVTLVNPRHTHEAGKWYWAALRYDGRIMSDFVNGVKDAEGGGQFLPFATGQISLGMRQNKVFWFQGAIREVRFHTQALPESELQRAP